MKEKILNLFRGYRRQPLSLFLFIATSLAALITFCVLAFLVAYILVNGIPHLNASLFEWKYTTDNQSVVPALINTVSITVLSLLIAVPLGIASAIYLTEYANKKSKIVAVISMTAETLSGIPSIVYGLFGNLFFLTALGWGYSLLSGSFTLAIMILPLVMRTTQEALISVPVSYREGSFGLGAGYSFRHHSFHRAHRRRNRSVDIHVRLGSKAGKRAFFRRPHAGRAHVRSFRRGSVF